MVSLVLVSVWQFFPFVVLAVLARLQSIPGELYEAAAIDGANVVQRFVHVTLPQLHAVLFIVILLRSIWMFTKFDTPWLMILGGGAETYIRTLPVYTYQRTFAYYEAGIGAAMAVLMFLMLAAATAIYFRLFGARRRYDHGARPAWQPSPRPACGGAARPVRRLPVRLDDLDRFQGLRTRSSPRRRASFRGPGRSTTCSGCSPRPRHSPTCATASSSRSPP